MVSLRLRHPKGVTSIEVDLDTATVLELQSIIFSTTEIPPSRQDLKCGYPPRPLSLIPELPVSSLGIGKGDQLMVNELKGPAASSSTATRPTEAKSQPRTQPQSSRPIPMPSPNTARKQPQPQMSSGPDTVPAPGGGLLVHRVVPDDNSCLFASVALVFEQSTSAASKLRQVVADVIKKDFDEWTPAVLGRPREEYIKKILEPNTWGGAIELSIFSKHYATEVCSIDVETGRIDRFGSDNSYNSRCILLYSGIHYDAISLSPSMDAPVEFHETLFSTNNQAVLEAAGKLASKLREKKAFTNTATFDLRCQICKKGLKGEKEASAHAAETGHVEFGEY